MGRLGAKANIDLDGRTLSVGENGLIRIDGIVLAKLVSIPGGGLHVQVYDRDRLRSICRGTDLVEIPLDVLANKLWEAAQK